MNLHSIETGRFKLDGGAMFGVVPKVLWERTNPSDEKNRIEMAMRCLLIEYDKRLILVDCGIGHKYDDKFKKIYAFRDEEVNLESSLNAKGFTKDDITDVILTHWHFDHGGGATEWNTEKERLEVSFKNAKYWVQKSHLETATHPNVREKASFFKENIAPVVESGQLELLDGETEFLPNIQLKVVNGHTEGQQLPLINYKGKQILYAADLFPTYGHLPLPFVMSYDMKPLVTLDERAEYLPWLAENEVVLMYEHDAYNECGLVTKNERGKFISGETFYLDEI